MLAIGLMSGTSGDGVDAALVWTDGESKFQFVHAITVPYASDLRTRLLSVAQHVAPEQEIVAVEREITAVHVVACHELLADAAATVRPQPKTLGQIQVIGFHGHTIRHDPSRGVTRQIGNASTLADAFACSVVSNFRQQDIAAGGQGAPLAPMFHRQLFHEAQKPTMVLNLGGVANVTLLQTHGEIIAGDTGPGCGLLDVWVHRQTGQSFDKDGRWALEGVVDHAIVEHAMQHPYFSTPLPKSADRFEFGFVDVSSLSLEDGAATLCAITTKAVANSVSDMGSEFERPATVWVTGGGAKHPLMMSMLQQEFENVQPIEAAGFRGDSLEAECFAWLAVRRLRDLPTSLPETTGCLAPTCGGDVTRPA